MWNNLHTDILTLIFSFLTTDSLAIARAVCKQWSSCTRGSLLPYAKTRNKIHPPWLLIIPSQNCRGSCYAYNSSLNKWYSISLSFIPESLRHVVTSVDDSLLLLKPSVLSSSSPLALCNPFTKRYRLLPPFVSNRSNPSIGVINSNDGRYWICAAGGIFGGSEYVSTYEIYNSQLDVWRIAGKMPKKYAARMMLWSTNGSVYCKGTLYWITSARVYSIISMKLDIENNSQVSATWREVCVASADRLEFAGLVSMHGGTGLGLVGGLCGLGICIWEYKGENMWVMVERLDDGVARELVGENAKVGSVKCVGGEGMIYFYRDLGSLILVWKEGVGRREWFWAEMSTSVRDGILPHFAIKGVKLWPRISPFCMLEK